MITKQALKTFLKNKGWKEDPYGNMLSKSEKVRFHFQTTSVRIEKAYKPEAHPYNPHPQKQWKKINSSYYKNISITDDKLIMRGVTYTIKEQA